MKPSIYNIIDIKIDGAYMNRELQERADRIERELREALVPLREELKRIKNMAENSVSGFKP